MGDIASRFGDDKYHDLIDTSENILPDSEMLSGFREIGNSSETSLCYLD